MTRADFLARLRAIDACQGAQDWISEHRSMSPAEMWATCERGDWMLWLGAKILPEERWRPIAYACADRAVRVHAVRAIEAACERLAAADVDCAELREHARTLAALPRIDSRESGRPAAVAASRAAVYAGGPVDPWIPGAPVVAHTVSRAAWSAAEAVVDAVDPTDDMDVAEVAVKTSWSAMYAAGGEGRNIARSAELRLTADEIRAAIAWGDVETALELVAQDARERGVLVRL